MKTVLKCLLVLVAAYGLLIVAGLLGAGIGSVELLILLVLCVVAMVVIVRRDRRVSESRVSSTG